MIILHFLGEERYYLNQIKNFDSSLKLTNFFLLSIFLSVVLVLLIFRDVIKERLPNIINFLPFLFLFQGTYSSINFNFWLLIVSFFGINFLLDNKISKYTLIVFAFFLSFWILNIGENSFIFDIDKLKGFVSSSFNVYSVLFWASILFLTISGINFIIKNSKDSFNLNLFKRNSLISGSLVVILGYISASNQILNFLSYYFLGLNKKASESLQSVGQNAWRGLSPSAESIGEYFGFTVLLVILISFFKNYRLNYFEVILLLINLYGLYESNNFASALTLVLLIITAFLFKKIISRKFRILYLVFLLIIGLYSYLAIFNTNSFNGASSKLLDEATSVAEINNLPTNNYGQTALDQFRYGEILANEEVLKNVSSSLYFFMDKYNENKISNLPNITSLISIVSIPLNRTEKWGVFIAKYNPDIGVLLFGYGPGQLADYYLGFPTKANTGLILPHSSLLSYLLFIGIIGLLIALKYILTNIYYNKDDYLFVYLNIFLIFNLLKSDSILYVNSFIFFLVINNLYKLTSKEDSL